MGLWLGLVIYRAAMDAVLAIDIGGTKLAAAVVDDTGAITVRDQVPTPAGDGAELWSALVGLISHVIGRWGSAPLRGVGVGCGGPMTPGGESVSPLNIGGWRRFPLRQRLGDELAMGAEMVHIDNDAKALALAEGWQGRAAGVHNYMAMVVSTGVGGGIVVDGHLLEGASGNAGHIGHVVVEPEGANMAGHAQGTLEVEASGTGIALATGRPSREADHATIARVGRLVGRAAGSTCNLLDLSLVVVAGSVALGYGEPFFAAAQAEMDRICVLDFSRSAVIAPAGLGANGPLVGAAAVAWRKLGHDIGVQ